MVLLREALKRADSTALASNFSLMKRFVSLIAAVTLLGACGGAATAPTTTFAPGTLVVTAIAGLRFDADTYGPTPAGAITFGYSNVDTVRHTLILAKDGQKVPNFKLVVNRKGDSVSGAVTLDKGTYEMICDVPGHSNMRATLTVD